MPEYVTEKTWNIFHQAVRGVIGGRAAQDEWDRVKSVTVDRAGRRVPGTVAKFFPLTTSPYVTEWPAHWNWQVTINPLDEAAGTAQKHLTDGRWQEALGLRVMPASDRVS